MTMHIATVSLLILASAPVLAAGPPEVTVSSTASVPDQDAVSRRASTLSADRVAALQKTIEKRKAKKARDREAFRVASAEARRMFPGPPQPRALRSVGIQGAPPFGPPNQNNNGPGGPGPQYGLGPMFGQAASGPGQCARQ